MWTHSRLGAEATWGEGRRGPPRGRTSNSRLGTRMWEPEQGTDIIKGGASGSVF